MTTVTLYKSPSQEEIYARADELKKKYPFDVDVYVGYGDSRSAHMSGITMYNLLHCGYKWKIKAVTPKIMALSAEDMQGIREAYTEGYPYKGWNWYDLPWYELPQSIKSLRSSIHHAAKMQLRIESQYQVVPNGAVLTYVGDLKHLKKCSFELVEKQEEMYWVRVTGNAAFTLRADVNSSIKKNELTGAVYFIASSNFC